MADSLTPVMRQYLATKERYPDTVLFFRMGDFYEMFFDDAIEAAALLDLTLTSRNKNNPNPIPMAGIPYHAANQYLSRLIKAGKKVAICEQMEPPGKQKGPVKREVVRVITPGVVLEDGLLESGGANFLVAMAEEDRQIGLVLLDASTGEFRGTICDDRAQMLSELARWAPKEVVVKEGSRVISALEDSGLMLSLVSEDEDIEPDESITPRVLGLAAGLAREYLRHTGVDANTVLREFQRYMPGERMYLSPRTMQSLELFEPMNKGGNACLIKVLDETLTPMGARHLRSWLAGPLTRIEPIEKRLDRVQDFFDRPSLSSELGEVLRRIGDIARAASRLTNGFGSPRDMVALLNGIPLAEEVGNLLDANEIQSFHVDPELLAWAVSRAGIINPEPPLNWREGGIFKAEADPQLAELIGLADDSKAFLTRYEAQERQRTGIPKLKIRYNRVFGYMIEVSKSQLDKVPEDFRRRQTLTNAERFTTVRLEELERELLTAHERRKALEVAMFEALCRDVAKWSVQIGEVVDAVAGVDVFRGLAQSAAKRGFVRPKLFDDRRLSMKQGRHPVVEDVLEPGGFVPNDLSLGNDDDFMVILTGPNMSGKSTIMRQVAIITIMAQIGAFVPADAAEIGLADAVLTRIGSGDDLAGGRSTFMVEMEEIAHILDRATSRSLLILDEVGRGTSTFDGLAIAWSIAEFIVEHIGARTMLATHYHEMTELAKLMRGVRNMSVMAREIGGRVVFLHTLAKGAANKSYGIEVAMLAKVPKEVVDRAREVLANLEMNEIDVVGEPVLARAREKKTKKRGPAQLELFSSSDLRGPSIIENKLMDIDPERLTPIDALNKLAQLVRDAKDRYS